MQQGRCGAYKGFISCELAQVSRANTCIYLLAGQGEGECYPHASPLAPRFGHRYFNASLAGQQDDLDVLQSRLGYAEDDFGDTQDEGGMLLDIHRSTADMSAAVQPLEARAWVLGRAGAACALAAQLVEPRT